MLLQVLTLLQKTDMRKERDLISVSEVMSMLGKLFIELIANKKIYTYLPMGILLPISH